MDKVQSALVHAITLTERKTLLISGIQKIDSFDDEEFLVKTTLGYIVIKGEGLEIIKLDTKEGNVSIKGVVNSLTYIDNSKRKEKEETVFGKLFK